MGAHISLDIVSQDEHSRHDGVLGTTLFAPDESLDQMRGTWCRGEARLHDLWSKSQGPPTGWCRATHFDKPVNIHLASISAVAPQPAAEKPARKSDEGERPNQLDQEAVGQLLAL